MKAQVERHISAAPFRLGYTFVTPVALVLSIYLVAYVGINTRTGSEALARALSALLAGDLEYSYIEIGYNLTRVDLFDARLLDPSGRAVIEAYHIGCTFAPSGLLVGRIHFSACDAQSGRVLVEQGDDGDFGLLQAFRGGFQGKNRPRNPRRVLFEDITLTDIDVLIVLPDLMMRYDRVSATGGSVATGRQNTEISASATVGGGRLVFSERIFSLGDGKSDLAIVEWLVERRRRPWVIARMPLPTVGEATRGPLDLLITSAEMREFRWSRDEFTFDALHVSSPDVTLDAAGWVRLVAERPKVPDRERGGLRFDGRVSASLHPTSRIFEYFMPGVVSDARSPRYGTPQIAPIEIDAYGNLDFVEAGTTTLSFRDLSIIGWHVERFDGDLTLSDGRLTLSDGASMDIWGGRVTGAGWMIPREGLWELGLCARGVQMARVLRPFIDLTEVAWADLAALELQTSPAECSLETSPGLVLRGDLTRKALEIAPAATTPADKEIQPPMLEGVVQGLELRWRVMPAMAPLRAARVDLSAYLDQRGRVVIARDGAAPGLRLRTDTDIVEFNGTIDTVNARFEPSRVLIESRDLGAWLGRFGVDQPLSDLVLRARFPIDGPLAEPRIGPTEVSLTRATSDARSPDFRASGQLRFDETGVSVRDARVTSSLGELTASGRIGLFEGSLFRWRADPTLDVQMELTDARAGELIPKLGSSAMVWAQFHLVGSARRPQIRGSELLALDTILAGEPLDVIQLSDFVVSRGRIDVAEFFVGKGKGIIRGSASYNFANPYWDITISGRDFLLREIQRLGELGVDLRGGLRFDMNLRGPPDDLDIDGSLVVTDLELRRYRIGGVSVAFDTDDGHLVAAAQVGGDLDVDITMPLTGGPMAVTGRFRRARLEELWPAAENVVDRSSISGQVDIRIDPWGTGLYEADWNMHEFALEIDSRRFVAPRAVRGTWSGRPGEDGFAQRLTINDFSLGSGDRVLTLRGTVESDGGTPHIAMSLGGDVDFSLLRFLPDLIVDAEGVAEVAIKVNGPYRAAQVVGDGRFGNARIAPRGLGTHVFLRPGTFSVTNDEIRFAQERPLSGTVFGGEFTAHGALGLQGMVPVSADFAFFVTNLAYRIPDQLNITLTADLRYRAASFANFDSYALSGNVEIIDARFYRNFDIVSDQFAFGDFGRNVASFELPIWQRVPALGRMALDLTITGRDRFRVVSRIANIETNVEFRTDLDVTGTFDAMNVQGQLEALDGSRVYYRGRLFEVGRAALLFQGQRDADGFPWPYLDAEVTAAIRPCVSRPRDSFEIADVAGRPIGETERVFVTAFLTGDLPVDLNFRLESTPFYDQRDQLSLILTGCTVDALTATAAGAPTLDIVLRPVIQMVERNVQERLDFDDVDLIPTTDGAAGIIIQDEVTPRFRWALDAMVGAGTETRQIVRGEYRLLDWLTLEVQEQTNREENIRIDTGVRFHVVLD